MNSLLFVFSLLLIIFCSMCLAISLLVYLKSQKKMNFYLLILLLLYLADLLFLHYNDFFEAHGIEKVESLITAWDTFSDEMPGQAERCDCKGKSVHDLPEELKDWGMYLADTRAE